MASMALKPQKRSAAGIFIRSQICTTPRPPPTTLSFTGQTAVVTGSNVGIGLEACRQILDRGLTHLVMGVRSVDKGNAAAAALRASHTGAQIEVWSLDMASYDSIRSFAQRCSTLRELRSVILNAAAFNSSFKSAGTGHEEMFQVNYLSTALLSALIVPILKSKNGDTGQPGRLTIIGSSASLSSEFKHRNANPLISSFDDPSTFGSAMERYSTTKMCVLVLVHKLAQSVPAERVTINTVDPGLVGGSSLHRSFEGFAAWAFGTVKNLASRTLEQGAWTYLDAVAVRGEDTHGGFVVDWELHP